MRRNPRNVENAEALKERLKHDSTGPLPATPGERAGGKPQEVPGGSYGVPPEEAERYREGEDRQG